MTKSWPAELDELTLTQAGVVSRRQALDYGVTSNAIDRLLASGRWRRLHPGVYSVFGGPITRPGELWAAVQLAGPGAVLSHQTAVELFKITDRPSSLLHVTIPADRHIKPVPGIVIHRSVRLAKSVHPSALPPRTRLEESVLDVADQAKSFEVPFNLAMAACQRRLTTTQLLTAAMRERARMRWRSELSEAFGAVDSGVHSRLEYQYLHAVERPHQLPRAVRQARIAGCQRHYYLDNLYGDYQLCVELDGQEAHPDEQRWQDLRRVNAIAEQGITVLRYGWSDVAHRPCQTAGQVAAVLRHLGWPGPARSCSRNCPVT